MGGVRVRVGQPDEETCSPWKGAAKGLYSGSQAPRRGSAPPPLHHRRYNRAGSPGPTARRTPPRSSVHPRKSTSELNGAAQFPSLSTAITPPDPTGSLSMTFFAACASGRPASTKAEMVDATACERKSSPLPVPEMAQVALFA